MKHAPSPFFTRSARATAAALLLALAAGCRRDGEPAAVTPAAAPGPECTGVATFGAGCFWCIEAVFQELEGVCSVEPGYAGGARPNPTYEEVCTGESGHAEVAQITFDPKKVSFAELLEVFWKTHDPTTLNRQGNDTGPQYRSAVFFHTTDQKREAEHYRKELDKSGAFTGPIVTEIVPLKAFYPAEAEHRNYFRTNPGAAYCVFIIRPKMDKFRKAFKHKLRKS